MVPNELGNRFGTDGSVHPDLLLSKAPDRPAISTSGNGESNLTFPCLGQRMPVIPVGFNNESRRLEYEVRLPSAEHRLVHLELQPTFLEFGKEKAFDTGHFLWHRAAQPTLAYLLDGFRRMLVAKKILIAKVSLTHLFPTLGRSLTAKQSLAYFLLHFWPMVGLAYLLPMLRRTFTAKMRQTQLSPRLRRHRLTFRPRHLMSNFNMNNKGAQ